MLLIQGISLHLVKKNKDEDRNWFILASISFFPLFIIGVYESFFSMLGFKKNPQLEIGLFAKGGLIMIVVGLFLFSFGYFKITNERDMKINHYTYLAFNVLSILILIYGIIQS